MSDNRTDLYNRLMFILMDSGIETTAIKDKFFKALMDYEISGKETALIVYTEGKNEILLKKFLLAKMVKGCTKRTIKLYNQCCTFILNRIGKDVDTITADDIKMYIASRMMQGVSAVGINSEIRPLSSFLTWLTVEEYIPKNPMVKVDKVKEEKKEKKSFTDMEVELIRKGCKTNRELAIIETLLSTGMRVSELTSVKITDIDNGKIGIIGKGNKHRTVYLNAKAEMAISEYLKERTDKNPYLFPGGKFDVKSYTSKREDWYKYPELVHESNPINTSTVESRIRTIGRKVGVEKAHPHRFRRTCATMALRRGMPIEMVSKMLGHSNIQTTQIYLDLSEQDLEAMHKKYASF